jgi:hypothetical protein
MFVCTKSANLIKDFSQVKIYICYINFFFDAKESTCLICDDTTNIHPHRPGGQGRDPGV